MTIAEMGREMGRPAGPPAARLEVPGAARAREEKGRHPPGAPKK